VIRAAQKNEINITPFVDVMLVLLIVFMVAAPLSTTNLNLTIPPPGPAAPSIEPVFVSLQKDGGIFVGTQRLGEQRGGWSSLRALLGATSGGDFSRPIFVRADQAVGYGEVVRLIDELRASGYRKVSLINEDVTGSQFERTLRKMVAPKTSS